MARGSSIASRQFGRAIPSRPVVLTPQTHISNDHVSGVHQPTTEQVAIARTKDQKNETKERVSSKDFLINTRKPRCCWATPRTMYGLYRCKAAGQQSVYLGQNGNLWRAFADRNLQSGRIVGNRPIQSQSKIYLCDSENSKMLSPLQK